MCNQVILKRAVMLFFPHLYPTTDLHQHEHLFQARPVIEFQSHIVQANGLWVYQVGISRKKEGDQYNIYTQRKAEFNELIHEVKVTYIRYQQVGQWAWMPCVHQI